MVCGLRSQVECRFVATRVNKSSVAAQSGCNHSLLGIRTGNKICGLAGEDTRQGTAHVKAWRREKLCDI